MSDVTSQSTIGTVPVSSKPTITGHTGDEVQQNKQPPSDINRLYTGNLITGQSNEMSMPKPLPLSTPLSSSITDMSGERQQQQQSGPTVVTTSSTVPSVVSSSSISSSSAASITSTAVDKQATPTMINPASTPLLSKNLYQHHPTNPSTSYFTPAPSYNNNINPNLSSSIIPPYSTSASYVNTCLSQQFGQSMNLECSAPPPPISSSTMMSAALIQPPFISSYTSPTFSSSSMPFASGGQIQPPPMFTMPSPSSVIAPHSSSSTSTTSFQSYKPTFPGGASYPSSLPPLTSSSGGYYGPPPPLVMPPPISNTNTTLFNPATSNMVPTPSAPSVTSDTIQPSSSAAPLMMSSPPPSQ